MVSLENKLKNINWTHILGVENVDLCCSVFYDTFYKLYDESFPIKTKTITERDEPTPWITSSVKKAIKNKNILFTLKKNKLISNDYYNKYCKKNKTNSIKSKI